MQQLPYELLQLIASNLLPHNQCRLALASKYHYKYLYTPLLKWHARKSPIEIPKVLVVNKILTLVQSGNKLIMYKRRPYGFVIYNLTKSITHYIDRPKGYFPYYIGDEDSIDMNVLYDAYNRIGKSSRIDHWYKYMNGVSKFVYLSLYNPFLRLDVYLVRDILEKLRRVDYYNLKRASKFILGTDNFW